MRGKTFIYIAVFSALLVFVGGNSSAYAATTLPTFNDCSGFVTLPADWTSQLQSQVTSSGGGTINPAWSIIADMEDWNPNQQRLYFYLSPNSDNGVAGSPLWLVTDSTNEQKVRLFYNSAMGTIYRVNYSLNSGSWASVYTLTQSGAYSAARVLQCGFFNRHILMPIAMPFVYNWGFNTPVAQVADFGFINPPVAPTSSGTTSGSTSLTLDTAALVQKGSIFIGISMAGLISYLLIKLFAGRRL